MPSSQLLVLDVTDLSFNITFWLTVHLYVNARCFPGATAPLTTITPFSARHWPRQLPVEKVETVLLGLGSDTAATSSPFRPHAAPSQRLRHTSTTEPIKITFLRLTTLRVRLPATCRSFRMMNPGTRAAGGLSSVRVARDGGIIRWKLVTLWKKWMHAGRDFRL